LLSPHPSATNKIPTPIMSCDRSAIVPSRAIAKNLHGSRVQSTDR
jgi:hypothetical protein